MPSDEEVGMIEERRDGLERALAAELAQKRGDHLDSRSAVAIGAAADVAKGRGIIFHAERRLIEADLRLEDEEVGASPLDHIALAAPVDDEDVAVGEAAFADPAAAARAGPGEAGGDLGRFPEGKHGVARLDELEHGRPAGEADRGA